MHCINIANKQVIGCFTDVRKLLDYVNNVLSCVKNKIHIETGLK